MCRRTPADHLCHSSVCSHTQCLLQSITATMVIEQSMRETEDLTCLEKLQAISSASTCAVKEEGRTSSSGYLFAAVIGLGLLYLYLPNQQAMDASKSAAVSTKSSCTACHRTLLVSATWVPRTKQSKMTAMCQCLRVCTVHLNS